MLALFVLLTAGLITAPALAASTDFKGDACAGLNSLDNSSSTTCSPGSEAKLSNILGTIINILSILVGVVAVIMVIVGGFRFITSGGDSSHTASARNTVIYALIGLVIAALAQVLVHFVLLRASGVALCQYNTNIPANDAHCVAPKE